MHPNVFVAYYRVSTDRQGRSGLGLEAQQEAVRSYLAAGDHELVAAFTETESGRRDARPELEKALALCRKRQAKLVIAKLDRLSRNVAFIARLMEAGVEFVAVDNPYATTLTIHILAAVAQHEREMIAERTRIALRAAKARGTRLGRHGAETLAPAYQAAAVERAQALAPVVAEIRASGEMSLRAIAAELNARDIPTTQGKTWSAMQVHRLLKRVARL